MTVSEKNKTIDDKIEQNKAQYNLCRQKVRFQLYRQIMLVNINFHKARMFYLEKKLLEKAAIIKRFKFLPLDSRLNKQTDMVRKQYQGLKKVYESDKKEEEKDDKTAKIKKYNKSKLIYNGNHNFYKYHNIRKFDSLSFF